MYGHILRYGTIGSYPISCHFRDCVALLVSTKQVSGTKCPYLYGLPLIFLLTENGWDNSFYARMARYYLCQGVGYAIRRGCLSVSVSVQPHAKSDAWIYIKFLPKVGLGPISR